MGRVRTIIYQISLHGSAYDARKKQWSDIYSETGCKPRRGWLDPIHNRSVLKGEFGCSVSHLRVWEKIANSNSNGIILEEDAVYDSIDTDKVDRLLNSHDSVWLGYRWNDMGYWYNCHAYAITPDTARLLIQDFKDNIIPVDEWVPLKLKHKQNYFYEKEVVTQIPRSTRPSTIEEEDSPMIDSSKINIITVATDETKMWPLSQSCDKHQINLVNLGKGDSWKSEMEGYDGLRKVELVKNLVKDLAKDEIVLFVDGYDTFFTEGYETIVQRFLDFDVDILFGAEQECWPITDNHFYKESWIDDGTPYRYLNSGLYIGYAGAINEFLNLPSTDAKGDDQLYCQTRYLKLIDGTVETEYANKVGLDYEAYIFQNHDTSIKIVNGQLWNDKTNCCGCIYHGNGGKSEKDFFYSLAEQFGYKELSSPITRTSRDLSYKEVAQDLLVTKLLSESECKDLIAKSDALGGWGNLDGDKFPAQEIRLKKLGLWKQYEVLWRDRLFKICEKHWKPVEYMGLRDAFTMRYAMDTQKSLGLHTDASLITGSVKLNDNYEGATLYFPRQDFTNLDVPVGSCILFPSQVTHGHYVDELQSGVKYSLTMWTSRYVGDEN